MSGLDYNNALAVFFPFYVLAEIPSNIMMKKTRPSIWIPSIMVGWAITCTLMGVVQNYNGLMAARAFLGITEGGLFPGMSAKLTRCADRRLIDLRGVTYYITMWYRRHEVGFRTAIFFSAATAAGAFGGLLARGINEMSGVGGRPGWSWIFILEGLFTLFVALLAFKVMQDYPSTARFLSPEERNQISKRLKLDRSSLSDDFDMKFFWHALQDWKIYVHMLITIGVYTSLYSISLFLPTVIKTLGYADNQAQLMTVPPYIFGCLLTLGSGWLADRMRTRGVFMLCFSLVTIVGFVMLLVSQNIYVKYAGCFLIVGGVYPNVPQGIAWNGNNIGGSLKRGVGLAMHVGFGNLGGIIASYSFLTKDSPRFLSGISMLIGLLCMSLILQAAMTAFYRLENARRDRQYKAPEMYTEEERLQERERGDLATFYRYTV